MSKQKREIMCTKELSLAEYINILNLIQTEHSFGVMGGANVKYVDSDVHIHGILDTRDSSVFRARLGTRGFEKVGFSGPVLDPENAEISDKTMYDAILDYLKASGAISISPLTSRQIGHLRGTDCEFGDYSGRKPDVDKYPELAEFGEYSPKIHCFHFTSKDILTGKLLFSDATRHSILIKGGTVVFRGTLETLPDLLQALRLVGIKTSY